MPGPGVEGRQRERKKEEREKNYSAAAFFFGRVVKVLNQLSSNPEL